jgi:hypothetical protein
MIPSTRIGDLLHRDHMATVAALEGLERLISRNRKPPVADAAFRTALGDLAALARAEVEAHFGFEEGQIFPLFLAQGQTGIVEILTQEHETILPLARRVATMAEGGAADGFDPDGWAAFRLAAGELIERELFHIQKEEMGLLAGIAMLIDPATDTRLAEAFAALAR